MLKLAIVGCQREYRFTFVFQLCLLTFAYFLRNFIESTSLWNSNHEYFSFLKAGSLSLFIGPNECSINYGSGLHSGSPVIIDLTRLVLRDCDAWRACTQQGFRKPQTVISFFTEFKRPELGSEES